MLFQYGNSLEILKAISASVESLNCLRISLISFWLLLLQTHAIPTYHMSKQTNKNPSKSEEKKPHSNVSKCLWQCQTQIRERNVFAKLIHQLLTRYTKCPRFWHTAGGREEKRKGGKEKGLSFINHKITSAYKCGAASSMFF